MNLTVESPNLGSVRMTLSCCAAERQRSRDQQEISTSILRLLVL